MKEGTSVLRGRPILAKGILDGNLAVTEREDVASVHFDALTILRPGKDPLRDTPVATSLGMGRPPASEPGRSGDSYRQRHVYERILVANAPWTSVHKLRATLTSVTRAVAPIDFSRHEAY